MIEIIAWPSNNCKYFQEFLITHEIPFHHGTFMTTWLKDDIFKEHKNFLKLMFRLEKSSNNDGIYHVTIL